MALFAPMASARAATATAVKPGLRESTRIPKRKSCHRQPISIRHRRHSPGSRRRPRLRSRGVSDRPLRADAGRSQEEQVMGWHCYLDDKVRFAFQAKCITARIVSPLKNGETVEALRTALEDACVATTGQILPGGQDDADI